MSEGSCASFGLQAFYKWGILDIFLQTEYGVKKILYVVILVAAAAQSAYSRDVDWGMLLDLGLVGNYEDAESEGNAHMIPFNLLVEMGGGFYISRFFMRAYVDIGAAVSGDVKIGDQTFSIRDHIDDYSFKVARN